MNSESIQEQSSVLGTDQTQEQLPNRFKKFFLSNKKLILGIILLLCIGGYFIYKHFNKSCDPTCVNGTCNTTSNSCECKPGYIGNDCSQKLCPNNCSANGFCDTKTGICNCSLKYKGDDCGVSSGVGVFSGKTCPNNCSGNGTCNSGLCLCKTGYKGNDCSESSCSLQGTFNNMTNKCDCDKNWSGDTCSIKKICICLNGGTCDSSGNCICNSGYTGANCAIKL